MSKIEEIGTNARSADGYVVLFRINDGRTGVLVVPTKPLAFSLRKLTKAIECHQRLDPLLEGFQITQRVLKNSRSVSEIKFAIRGEGDTLIEEFLEYAKQARVLINPIVSDLRDFSP